MYQITVTGRCTNGFTAKLIDSFIKNAMKAIGYQYASTEVVCEVRGSRGDFDAFKEVVNE